MINWQRTFLRSLKEIALFAQLLHPVVISIGYSFDSQTLVTQLLFTINRFILHNPLINNKTIVITPSSESCDSCAGFWKSVHPFQLKTMSYLHQRHMLLKEK